MNKFLATESAATFRVYVEDTDLMGIVYHSNYLYFFERARTEMFRNAGLSLTMMAKHGTHFAIHEVQLKYHAPARLDDLLTIKTSCENIRASTLVFNQFIHNESGNLLCEAIVRVVCVNNELKPKRLPKEFIGGN
ncbi:tol-pal system-associated acyl-CoA thioesterase [Legionella adelaidensis]|uniref:tol-pal system-associated acyl-CoA thioesterase n=1 Tax=Legionella adelaidensis TaxID=45056 RepID=UPI0022771A3C|nr:tol-pal system-associated acyl-CoA thioesterase [Legionella adelaidensis]